MNKLIELVQAVAEGRKVHGEPVPVSVPTIYPLPYPVPSGWDRHYWPWDTWTTTGTSYTTDNITVSLHAPTATLTEAEQGFGS